MNSLDSFEGVDQDEEFVRHPDGTLHQYIVKDQNGSFRCICGCNVFHKRVGQPNKYLCNACPEEYFAS
jgi:hypothetical protein